MLNRIVPEIDYLADPRARAIAQVRVMRTFGMTGLGGFIISLVAIFFATPIADSMWYFGRSPLGAIVLLFLIFVPCFLAIQGMLIVLFRGSARDRLRQQFAGWACTRCLACGYDLTGNTSGRCPECGAGCTLKPLDS